jgi:hypothetical protein
MGRKITDEVAVALAQMWTERWERDNSHLDGYEVQRALLMDAVLIFVLRRPAVF